MDDSKVVYPRSAIDYGAYGVPWGCEIVQELAGVGRAAINCLNGEVSVIDGAGVVRVFAWREEQLELVTEWQLGRSPGDFVQWAYMRHVLLGTAPHRVGIVVNDDDGQAVYCSLPVGDRLYRWPDVVVHDLTYSEVLEQAFVAYSVEDNGFVAMLDLATGELLGAAQVPPAPSPEVPGFDSDCGLSCRAHPAEPVVAVNWSDSYASGTYFMRLEGESLAVLAVSIDQDCSSQPIGFSADGERIGYTDVGADVYAWESGKRLYSALGPDEEQDSAGWPDREDFMLSANCCWVENDLALIGWGSCYIAKDVSSEECALLVCEDGQFPKLCRQYEQHLTTYSKEVKMGTLGPMVETLGKTHHGMELRSVMSLSGDLLLVSCGDGAQVLRLVRS